MLFEICNFIKHYYHYLKQHLKYERGATILIHIGKCGGSTLREGINHLEDNLKIHVVHGIKPLYRKDLKYIIVARGPISRIYSAFNWRYKLVVKKKTKKNQFKGEYEVLSKYNSLNNLAKALYSDSGKANKLAQKEILKIHHIRENISFYLKHILDKCSSSQIQAVLMQESLNEDIYEIFGYKNQYEEKRNKKRRNGKNLSAKAIKNLKRFFVGDFQVITKLYCLGKIKNEIFIKAISDESNSEK